MCEFETMRKIVSLFCETSVIVAYVNSGSSGLSILPAYSGFQPYLEPKLKQSDTKENKNSSGDEIANVNFCTTTTYM